MKTLNEIFSTTFTDALGWTLFHSLWQGALIAFALYIFLVVFRKTRANIKYFVSLSALFSILVIAVITFIYQLNIDKPVTNSAETSLYYLGPILSVQATHVATDSSSGFTVASIFAAIQSQMPLLLLGWLLGVFIAAVKLTGGYFYMKRKIGKALSNCPETLKQLLPKLPEQLDLRKAVRICEVPFLKTPAIFGHLKPIILIPIGLVNHLSPQQVEMVILHEIAHIKRNDFLANIIQSVLEVIFFFNPAVWWISREIRQERENCCDDLIIKAQGQPLQYIKTLAAVNHFNTSGFKLLPGFFGSGKGQLLKRMQRLVGTGTSSYSPQMYKVVALLLLLLSFLYFGWAHKNQSAIDQNKVSADASAKMLYSRFNLLSTESPTVMPQVKADTLKKEKIREQEAKIRAQEARIKALEAKIEAMEARENAREKASNDWTSEYFREGWREQLDMTLDLKDRLKFQLDEMDFDWMKDMETMFNDTLIKEFKHFDYFDHMDDHIAIKSEIQEQLKVINEQIEEGMQEFKNSQFEDFAMDMESFKEKLHLKQLDMQDIQREMDEAMNRVKEELHVFKEELGQFRERLLQSLIEDGIIDDDFEKVRITQKNGTIIVNGEKLSDELSKKYKTMIEVEMGKKYLNNKNFSFQFDRDWHWD
ncbi:M56 family metallopeptidase [Fulvivirgaceae bacterium BMA12]|uniref:M56 family metallopeptidase n=1 Tax=Agaribacillus aureus TaxID=3051825 RepID=A0ABT8L4B7_9BACT|nr:M56 family metallopeptidase [Fulvivirgaceae bacterium BMA12]